MTMRRRSRRPGRPRISRGADTLVLRFIPQADLGVLDPIWTTAYVTRNHAIMVFDTLYGTSHDNTVSPQMVAGHTTQDDKRTWILTLRNNLSWRDNQPVLARDCVASIRRWEARDSFGQTLLAATDELSAPDDKTIRFRLKRPFPLLPAALGKAGSSICAIMSECLALTDPFRQVTEMVGSGPFRFKPSEHIAGARAVYERNTAYVPRPDGTPSITAGHRIVHIDRVEWIVIPMPLPALPPCNREEMDWWKAPALDLLPLLKRNADLVVPPPIRWSGLDEFDPAVHTYIRGNGRAATRGWPTSENLESLREEWLSATDLKDRQRIASQIQQQAFVDVPYIPLGQLLPPTVHRRSVTDILNGYALFWNLRKV